MNKRDISKKFYVGIKKVFEQLFNEKAKFNYYIYGKVIQVNGDGTYDVEINGEISTLKARSGLNLEVTNVCQIIVANNDYSKKFIDDIRIT